ncbi:U3 small nucleolar ribonucleoprotein IMP4 [Daphnia magna]|uniref:U3 small nucleolar ribonucleoprotein IMP4 n=1 Tax=Daphnia magna TaxID=35525 RepID=A0A164NE46_9CRUS|nr:U3 small nucleolar ribonucleoprotein IMP4 [Daphnia magna]
MLRRQARLRREYLYRKSLEGRQKAIQDKKDRLRQALEGRCG